MDFYTYTNKTYREMYIDFINRMNKTKKNNKYYTI